MKKWTLNKLIVLIQQMDLQEKAPLLTLIQFNLFNLIRFWRGSLNITNNKKIFFWCALFGYLYFSFFSIIEWTRIGYFNQPGMALTPFPSSVGWDKMQTLNLSIVNLVCYPQDQTFAYTYCFFFFFFKSIRRSIFCFW